MKRKIAIRATVGMILCGLLLAGCSAGADKVGAESTRPAEGSRFEVEATEVFTVKFDSAGGSVVESQTVARGYKVKKPEDPTKQCACEFDGWYVGDEKWSFIGYVVTEDVTLTARWVDCFGLSAEGIRVVREFVEDYDGGKKYTWRDISEIEFSEVREGLFEYKIIFSNGKTYPLRLFENYMVRGEG